MKKLITCWLSAIVAANLSIYWFGPEVSVVNAFLFIGLLITTRDALHEGWKGEGMAWKMGCLIAAGGAISWVTAPGAGKIVLASVVAFAVSEAFDALVYQRLLNRHPLLKINGSNVVSAALDSAIFPTLAFGGILWPIMLGQFIAKVSGGAIWSVVISRKSRIAILVALGFAAPAASSQNIQHHYDFRGFETTTLEWFKPGKFETYVTIDRNWNDINLSYGEGIGYWNLPDSDWALTTQINYGESDFFEIGPIYLYGIRRKSFEVLYLSNQEVQFTYVWYKRFAKGKIQFSGFMDVWSSDNGWVVLSKPHIWYFLKPWLAIGGKLEISKNFNKAG